MTYRLSCPSSPPTRLTRVTPASSPTWTGPKTASTWSPTQETMRSSSVGRQSHTCTPSRCQLLMTKLLLLFSGEASCGKHVTNMDTVRNIEWATSTCTLSFSTFGGFKYKRSFKSGVCWLSLRLCVQNSTLKCCFKTHQKINNKETETCFISPPAPPSAPPPPRNLAGRSRRHGHKCRVQVT